jgi:hypothetical protein
MEPAFAKLLVALADANVRFVVVGGVAVALNGFVRMTEDIDLLVDDEPENLQRLLATLTRFGEGFARELKPADFTAEEGAIRIVEETESCVIDLFVRMRGLSYMDVAGDAVTFAVAGHPLLHASRRRLIQLKEGSMREKDQLDIAALRRLERDPRALD